MLVKKMWFVLQLPYVIEDLKIYLYFSLQIAYIFVLFFKSSFLCLIGIQVVLFFSCN